MLDRNTSEQRRPMASLRGMPVISSAARLKDVMRHSASTVKTPSEMLSRIASVGVVRAGFITFLDLFAMVINVNWIGRPDQAKLLVSNYYRSEYKHFKALNHYYIPKLYKTQMIPSNNSIIP
jgi:hypothetical protein